MDISQDEQGPISGLTAKCSREYVLAVRYHKGSHASCHVAAMSDVASGALSWTADTQARLQAISAWHVCVFRVGVHWPMLHSNQAGIAFSGIHGACRYSLALGTAPSLRSHCQMGLPPSRYHMGSILTT